jgi:hypothetical protein
MINSIKELLKGLQITCMVDGKSIAIRYTLVRFETEDMFEQSIHERMSLYVQGEIN